jgi:four helix bundle protein
LGVGGWGGFAYTLAPSTAFLRRSVGARTVTRNTLALSFDHTLNASPQAASRVSEEHFVTITSYRDLRVWRAAIDLTDVVYDATSSFPVSELYGLTSQVRRSAVSVASNIAEGHTREHTKEYLHHVSIAQASLAELGTQIEIAQRRKYLAAIDAEALQERITSLSRQLYALRNALLRN